MHEIEANYQQVLARIKRASDAAKRANMPKLLAVSKKHSIDKIMALAQLGQLDFGESYAQEGVEKIKQLSELPLIWHFIGPIQSNKTKLIAENFAWVHSIDRMKVLRRLISQRPAGLKPMNMLLQLKIGDESTKSGADLDQIYKMVTVIAAAEHCVFRGLMCIPPPSTDYGVQQAYFQQAKHVYDDLAKKYPAVDTLSMGMSGDLEAAIETGSTLVRVGTDIFGRRQ